jgi:hypothetical protein
MGFAALYPSYALAAFLIEGRIEVDSNVRAARWEDSLGRFVEFRSGRSSLKAGSRPARRPLQEKS